MHADHCFLVLDTESSLCHYRQHRVLVSVAYEVVQFCGNRMHVRFCRYEVVKQPPYACLDPISEQVHGLSMQDCQGKRAGALRDVLGRLLDALDRHRPLAVVGHDIANDVVLIVTEALRCGIHPSRLRALQRLLCTKLYATGPCGLPQSRCGDSRITEPCSLPSSVHEYHPVFQDANQDLGFLKWPTLEESYRMLVPDNVQRRLRHPVHDARGDVERCRAVFSAILRSVR